MSILLGVKGKIDAFWTRLDLKPLFFGQRSIQHIKCMVVLNQVIYLHDAKSKISLAKQQSATACLTPLSLEVDSQPSKSHSSTMEPFLES